MGGYNPVEDKFEVLVWRSRILPYYYLWEAEATSRCQQEKSSGIEKASA
jgi:hypothetical protein